MPTCTWSAPGSRPSRTSRRRRRRRLHPADARLLRRRGTRGTRRSTTASGVGAGASAPARARITGVVDRRDDRRDARLPGGPSPRPPTMRRWRCRTSTSVPPAFRRRGRDRPPRWHRCLDRFRRRPPADRAHQDVRRRKALKGQALLEHPRTTAATPVQRIADEQLTRSSLVRAHGWGVGTHAGSAKRSRCWRAPTTKPGTPA